MKPIKIRFNRHDVLFIIHNECIYHVKNIGSYWDKNKKHKVTVEFVLNQD
jgi:hypothetical protein